MLAAMMAGGASRYANQHNFAVTSTWTVPSGVTTVNIFAAGRGALEFTNDAGGGGGGSILNVSLNVGLDSVFTCTTTALSSSVPGTSGYEYTITGDVTGRGFTIQTGWDYYGGGLGGTSRVYWNNGSTYTATGGQNGTNGSVNTSIGGLILGGGGGGNNNLSTGVGANGGTSGPFAGAVHNGAYGGGGGGFFPGLSYTGSTYIPSSYDTTFLYFQWN